MARIWNNYDDARNEADFLVNTMATHGYIPLETIEYVRSVVKSATHGMRRVFQHRLRKLDPDIERLIFNVGITEAAIRNLARTTPDPEAEKVVSDAEEHVEDVTSIESHPDFRRLEEMAHGASGI